MESRAALTVALKGVVPISVSVALAAVAMISLRGKREDVTWWQRGGAWLALAKATRFVLESALCGWIATRGLLHGAAMAYESIVCALYFATVPLLALAALRLLDHDPRARRSGIAVALVLVAIEAGLAVMRPALGLGDAAHEAVGIAAVSLHGSIMMTVEALAIGIVSAFVPRTV